MCETEDPGRIDVRDTVSVQEWNRWGGCFTTSLGRMKLTVNAAGNVVIFEDQRPSHWREMFPATTPAVDTFFLASSLRRDDSLRRVVTRRFDTTLFGRSVHAFSFVSPPTSDEWSPTETTVADSFGVIRTVYLDRRDTLALHSCIIDGRPYRWEQTSRRYMEPCVGNVYQWHAAGRDWFGNPYDYHPTIRLRADTVIDGRQFFAGFQNLSIHQDDSGLYRLRGPGGSMTLLLPGNATIGTPTGVIDQDYSRSGIVVDTATRWFEGRDRHVLTITLWTTMAEGAPFTQVWVEGIGMVSISDYDLPWPNYYELNYASICGKAFGRYVGTVSSVFPPEIHAALPTNYPNPFSTATGTTIHFTVEGTSSRHVELRVHDALGRCIATVLDQEMMPGEHRIPFRPGSLPPGLYSAWLRIGDFSVTRTLIAVE